MGVRRTSVVASAAVAAVFALAGCGGTAAKTQRGGDTATKAEVVRALQSTGYELRYRRAPVIPGYDFVMGRATSKRGGIVDFVVVIRRAGPLSICETPPESDCHPNPDGPQTYPELPFVRYEYEPGSISAGNVEMWSRQQSPERKGRQFFAVEPKETQMVLNLDEAATRDIASRYHENV